MMKEQRKMIKCLSEKEVPMEFRGSDLEKLFGIGKEGSLG